MMFNPKNECLKQSLNERERESNSALNLFSPQSSNRNDRVSPSLAEGDSGWVSCHTERSEVSQNTQINRDISRSRAQYDKETSVIIGKDSTSAIADNDSTSVIASKSQDLRGNPQRRINKVDCCALDSAKMQNLIARNDGNAKSFNDKIANFANAKSTHPHPTGCEALAEAKTPSAREGAYFGLPRATSCARNDKIAKSHKKTSVIASKKSVSEFLRGNPQCNISKVDCHALDSAKMQNLIARNDGNAKSHNDSKHSVIVDNDSTSVIVGKDSASVIASERSERGNLYPQSAKHAFDKPNKIDCHALDSAQMQNLIARNDGIVKFLKKTHPQTPSAREGAFKANTTDFCHTKQSEVSQNVDKNRDISGFALNMTSQKRSLNITKSSKPKKRLALSLATSAFVAGLATIDSAAAACRVSGGVIICDGSVDISTISSSASTSLGSIHTLQLGSSDSPLNITGSGTITGQSAQDRLITGNTLNAGSLTIGGTWGSVHIGNGSRIESLTFNGTVGGQNLTPGDNWHSVKIGGGTLVSNLSVNSSFTITNGAMFGIGDRGVINSGFATDFSSINNTNITFSILNGSITIDDKDGDWNSGTISGQHIKGKNGNGNTKITTADSSITINIGEVIDPNKTYNYDQVVINSTLGKHNINGNSCNVRPNGYTTGCIGYNHLVAGTGVKIIDTADHKGFKLAADISTSYGANMFRALTLGSLRRTIMTQNVLDTMTTKTFHSDRYYNQEVELRLLQYDMSRLTNRSSKFAKNARKNQKQIDKTREKIAKLTLEQSKGQNLDKGYNNFEVIDQLDAIFIPYTGRRDWRFFALPYATHSYVDFGLSDSQEYAGGALAGLQRNLRANGIFGGFVGYEFINTDTMLKGNIPTRVQTNSLQAGLNYFQTFSITKKVMEGFIKASIRGGIDLPNFTIQEGGFTMRLESNDKSAIPLVYNVGAEVKGGVTFYQFKRNSYVSPEVSLSYDMLGSNNTKIKKPSECLGTGCNANSTPNYRPLGADETYDAFVWHLPQLGVHVRYYKMYGNKFRTNFKAGVKYNMLNKQETTFRIAKNLIDKGTITLPAVYGNLGLDLIWMIKKNHELSFGYDGLFYASSFAKERDNTGKNVATSDWFNGVTTNLNFKYAYWFGGSDYVTDKDGNAVARSIVEGGKKKSKSKKSKKKKEKKSKKKVYYIDG